MRKIIFAGTPEFSRPTLEALIHAGYSIVSVLTQPDKPKGRGKKLSESPIKALAKKHDIPILQPKTLKSDTIVSQLKILNAELMVVVAYGLIIPAHVLSIPTYGCINIHASLLPRWRGAAPIPYAILSGDSHTGISLMQMDEGLDTGPWFAQQEAPISTTTTAAELSDRLAHLGATTLIDTLPSVFERTAKFIPQSEEGMTYAPKISKVFARIDWQATAIENLRKIHALNPAPVAWSMLGETPIRIYHARLDPEHSGTPGEILACHPKQGIIIACGEHALILEKIQMPGKNIIDAKQAANHSLFRKHLCFQ